MRQLLIPLFIVSVAWTGHFAHAQIAVGCFGNQPDSSVGADTKSYQDIYMSQGACTNFCKGIGTSYALTLDGSSCRCSNQAPLGSNKVDDSKCDKPCMGYPFEMCGGTSSSGLANVLLIGSSTSAPSATTGSSGSSGGNNNSSNNSGDNGAQVVSGGKALNANNPDDASSGSGGTSAGAVAAGVVAVIAFGILFAVAVVFSKRRRQRLAQAAWTENMLLPSSLIHSSNADELEGHDYTRSSPLYRNPSIHHHHQAIPLPPSNAHFPPPPVLHPRQSGAMHMQQPSFPPPPMMAPRYNSIRAGGATFQPFPHPSVPQGDAAYLNYKEPLSPAIAFGRGPQAIQATMAALKEEGGIEHQEEMRERPLSRPSIRSMGSVQQQHQQQQQQHHYHDRRGSVQRGSVDSSATEYYE